MKLTHLLLGASLVLGATLSAQGQLLRGKVEDLPGTSRFRLDFTNLELVSSTLSLSSFVGQELTMTVAPVSAGVLNVLTATPTEPDFDMGNLRLGRSDRWEISGAPGSAVGMFLTATALTGYLPFGPFGTWLLGSSYVVIATGTIGGQGKLETWFQPPNVPQLVGTSWTAQAVRIPVGGAPFLTNLDGKELRAD